MTRDLNALCGLRIREARRADGLTLVELSDRLGGAPSYGRLSEIERAEQSINLTLLERIANALGRPPAWFLVENAESEAPAVRELRRAVAARDPAALLLAASHLVDDWR